MCSWRTAVPAARDATAPITAMRRTAPMERTAATADQAKQTAQRTRSAIVAMADTSHVSTTDATISASVYDGAEMLNTTSNPATTAGMAAVLFMLPKKRPSVPND